ncbi:MAG: DUF192 domain-containing protein [Gemmatimonadaceae bacterium]
MTSTSGKEALLERCELSTLSGPSWCRVLLLAIMFAALACNDASQDADETPVLSFDVARMRLTAGADTTHLLAELARNSEQHTLGLMERHHLADSAGMLFLYSTRQPASAGFWMFRTRIPLDIAFMDSLGTIGDIQHMVPCTATLAEGCPSYPSKVPYHAALEVNADYFARNKLAVGSRLMLNDTTQLVSSAGKP